MPKIENFELLARLIQATNQGRVDWEETAKASEFTASFGGKWTLLMKEDWFGSPPQDFHKLLFKNSEGDTLVSISSEDDSSVDQLYELARRHALKIDDALADLLNEIDKPQN